MTESDLTKIAFVGDYLPRKCGIATFTHDLRGAVARASSAQCVVVPVDDIAGGYEYSSEVSFQISEEDLDAYRRAADYLNFSNVDVISLQHEFGIFGGLGGSHILAFLRDIRIPVVTTLHTVLSKPDATQRRVMEQLTELSTRLVVMTQRSRETLCQTYAVPDKQGGLDRSRHSRRTVRRSERIERAIRRGRQARRADVRVAVSEQGY